MDLHIPEVKFFPWVGDNYKAGYRNKRLLILGESMYERPEYTMENDLSSLLIKGDKKFRFYNKIYHSISDGIMEDFKAFWNSVAFYNYIQEIVGTGPRQRPSPEMWKNSEGTFRLVLGVLKPDCVLVLGRALWWNLYDLKLIVDDSAKKGSSYLLPDSARIGAACIRHPSSWGFKPAAWRSIACTLLTSGK
jgi:hypothetical protein